MSGDADNEEGASLPVRKLLQCPGWLYDGAVNGISGVDGLEELAQSYSTPDWGTARLTGSSIGRLPKRVQPAL